MQLPNDISLIIKELDGLAAFAKRSGEHTLSQIIRSCADNILACCYAGGNAEMTATRRKMIVDLADLARSYYRQSPPPATMAIQNEHTNTSAIAAE